VAVGAGVAAGVATTTSRLIATTISTVTRISVVAAVRRNCRVAAEIVTTSGVAIARLSSQLVAGAIAVEIPLGGTIPNIAAGPRIRIALLRIDSGAQPVVILLRTARLAPGNRLADKAAICLAIGRAAAASAIEPAVESVLAIDPAAVELIV